MESSRNCRGGGREISLEEFPLLQTLSTGETVRAEEFVLQAPDGRQVVTLVNATPIFDEAGDVASVVVTLQGMTPLEDLARMRAEFLGIVCHELRRRAAPDLDEQREPHRLSGLYIDYAERTVSVNNRPVRLTATGYVLLYELSVNAGRVMSHDQLLKRVWGVEVLGDARQVRAFVKKLRRTLGDDARNPTYIFTRSRIGYRMAKTEEPEEMTP